MRNALITFIAAALGVIVSMFGYQAWQRHEAELEKSANEQAEQQALKQGIALDQQIAAEQRAIEAIRNDVVAISGAKLSIAEFYMSTGRMPVKNAEAGLPEPEKYRGRSLHTLSLGDDGRIVLEFDALSGHDGGVIELVPDLAGIEAMGMQWRCTTRDFPQIVRALPACSYVPGGADDRAVPPPTPSQR